MQCQSGTASRRNVRLAKNISIKHPPLRPTQKRLLCVRYDLPLSKMQFRQDEDGVWIAKSTLLPGCHAHGRDHGEATLRFQQAAKAHLEALLETGRPIP